MTDEIHREWGRSIQARREHLGLTQADLARRLDVRASSVCRWESGDSAPSDANKMRIAQVLDEDARVLFPLVSAS